ncbi:hypothetical protein [Microbacterium sp. SORGH_AS_0862]|uniref:hypothetical protein n=1 Tax=Microbacterium sp. SORGH_AS_0862 TaxID=3041789 RepID=UPI00278D8A5F|nr:hypothetical protein [Microbacterium sp. SORGH_AS_0862]MDQ1206616.1 hypothetical protein [Microbacterium sp. SORGH_AS_0862]
MSSPVVSARGRLGHAVKIGDEERIATAARDLAAAKLESYIQKTVAAAPPLTAQQHERLIALLAGGATQ